MRSRQVVASSRRRSSAPAALYTYDWSAGAVGSETVTRSGTATYINASGVRQSAAANSLRVNYTGASPNGVMGVLVEPAITNLTITSTEISGAGWYGGGVTVNANSGAVGMDGSTALDTVTATATFAIRAVWIDFSASSYVTMTWYVKEGTSRWIYVSVYDAAFSDGKNIWVDLATGTIGLVTQGGTVISELRPFARKLGNGIVEITASFKMTGTLSLEVQINHASADGVSAGTVGSTYFFDSLQIESSQFPTSFIPTADTTVARGAETVTVPMANGTYDIFVRDHFGAEWRNAVTVGSGVYAVTPRAGQTHVKQISSYAASALSAQQKESIASSVSYEYLTGYLLNWSDEFDDPDLARFSESGAVSGSGGGSAWLAHLPGTGLSTRKINTESQLYVNPGYLGIQPFSVANSVLRIKADLIPGGTSGVPTNEAYEPDAPYKFYSGLLCSSGIRTWTYGVFEIRCKSSAVNGIWPAFWLYNPEDAAAGQYGEIDIMENIGNWPNKTSVNIHEYSGLHVHLEAKGREYYFEPGKTIADWHVYACKWEQGRVRWYVDGNLAQDISTTWLDNTPLFLLVNMALGTAAWTGASIPAGAGDPATGDLPAYLDVDYVRVYQTAA